MKHLEEQELLNLFESNQLQQTSNLQEEIQLAQQAASQHMKKNARINVRLSQFDLERLKRIAAIEGLPYQTLITSVLHKYAHSGLTHKSN
jgi:predicted DNA binding CopG/RHH family protein